MNDLRAARRAYRMVGLAFFLFLAACDSSTPDSGFDDGTIEAAFDASFDAGALVVTTAAVTVYRDPLTPIGDVPAGAVGTVVRSKMKSDAEWTEVDFAETDQVDGFVETQFLLDVGLPAPPPGPFVVGFVGCSMTRDKGAGLNQYTGVVSWDKFAPDGAKVMTQYSGGTITRWGIPGENGYNNKWDAFDTGLLYWPVTNLILWEICIREDEVTSDATDYLDEVQHIAGEIAERVPNVPVYVVGMVGYEPGMNCTITGPDGVAFAAEVAALAAAQTHAQAAAGLVLGPLGPDQVVGDGCHANASGMEEQALQIADWLNALSMP
jgi:hypothetical protein